MYTSIKESYLWRTSKKTFINFYNLGCKLIVCIMVDTLGVNFIYPLKVHKTIKLCLLANVCLQE